MFKRLVVLFPKYVVLDVNVNTVILDKSMLSIQYFLPKESIVSFQGYISNIS